MFGFKDINKFFDSKEVIRSLSTIGDFIRWGASQFNEAQLFFGHGTDNAVDEAVVLVLHSLHLSPTMPDIFWSMRLTTLEKRNVLKILQQRIQKRIPAPYLTHEAWFANLSFYVDSRVVIPRSPLAELIEQHFAPWVEINNVEHMLDLCTGSGCIAIASALLALPPTAEVDAVDISANALVVAQQNVAHYGLENRVHLVQSDLFSNLNRQRYDLIVCNPPYADAEEQRIMPEEYQHEPANGLAGGDDGLDLVKQILREAVLHLTPKGILIVEVGTSQTALLNQFPAIPFTWLEFQRGGEGVFLLTAEQLQSLDFSYFQEEH